MGCGPSVVSVEPASAGATNAAANVPPSKVTRVAPAEHVAAAAKGPSEGGPGPPGEEEDAAPNEPLTMEEISARIESGKTSHDLPVSGSKTLHLNVGWVSQRGFYPEALDKENQDSFTIMKQFGDDKRHSLFGVFDGHGKCGDKCSIFARDKLPPNFLKHEMFSKNTKQAYIEAFLLTNKQMHRQKNTTKAIDDSMSGTTAITVFFEGNVVYVANVGDSRSILCEEDLEGKMNAIPLSVDQTPFRRDERERCQRAGARVLTMDQIDGYKDPNSEDWGTEEDDGGDPPRLWLPDKRYPGTAFTRSIGDAVAETVGVIAEPEVLIRTLEPHDKFIVIASDGVFEFLSNESVMEMVCKFEDPMEACRAVVAESYRLWLQYEVRTDDITCIVIQLDGLRKVAEASAPAPTPDPTARRVSKVKKVETTMVRPVRRTIARAKRATINVTDSSRLTEAEINYIPPTVFNGTPDELKTLEEAVRANFLFQHLNADQRSGVFNSMERVTVKKDDVVINQGDSGDKFYIISRGHLDVLVSAPASAGEISVPVVVHTYQADGDLYPSFGELALMYDKPRAATVKAKTDGVLWALHRTAFRAIVMKSSGATITNVLKNVSVLKGLDRNQLQRLADILTQVHFNDGEFIIKQGDIGDTFYIVTSGEVRVTKSAEEGLPAGEVMRLGANTYFGERALLSGDKRAANVVAVGRVNCLYIGRVAFEEILGPLQEIIDADRRKREAIAEHKITREKFCAAAGLGEATLSDFEEGAVVHKPALGLLRLVKYKPSSSLYTMRVVSKEDAVDKKQTAQVIASQERVLALPYGCPYLVNVLKTFSDEDNLYALENAKLVCDLNEIQEDPFAVSDARFMALGIAIGLGTVHASDMQLRGVSTEMILVDANGFPQIQDFHFAKDTTARTYTLCGTPDYLAPEQVTNRGADYTADWWALGVLLFEMLLKKTPFTSGSASELAIYERITNYTHGALDIPIADVDLQSFVHALLNPDIKSRLGTAGGVAKDGLKEVLSHNFFKTSKINVEGVMKGEVESPFAAKASALLKKLVENKPDDSAVGSMSSAHSTGALPRLFSHKIFTTPGSSDWHKDW